MTTEPTESQHKRRWFQFSLRTLLILTTLCSIYFARWSHKARQQREAVAVLNREGFELTYDYQLGDRFSGPNLWPEWLIRTIGMDYLANVVQFQCPPTATDDSLKHLKGLSALKMLDLKSEGITDVGIDHLNSLTTLKWLSLEGSRITNAGVKRLKNSHPNCNIWRDRRL